MSGPRNRHRRLRWGIIAALWMALGIARVCMGQTGLGIFAFVLGIGFAVIAWAS